jgi:hypothetical protein
MIGLRPAAIPRVVEERGNIYTLQGEVEYKVRLPLWHNDCFSRNSSHHYGADKIEEENTSTHYYSFKNYSFKNQLL